MPVEVTPITSLTEDNALFSSTSSTNSSWVPVAYVDAPFPLEIFFQVCDDMIMHPERNSSSILRSDSLDTPANPEVLNFFVDYHLQRSFRRRILPKRPFDKFLDQDCFFCRKSVNGHLDDGLVVMSPLLTSSRPEDVPFYHPKVAGLAFWYGAGTRQLQLHVLPLGPDLQSSSAAPVFPPESRTYRTAQRLLEMLHKHGKSLDPENGPTYVKRVHHDIIVPREAFQDLYLRLKDKYTWIVDNWQESTDPLKHVFEDVAIATFLICLWRDLYSKSNGRPPGGFVDVGCGNGLLAYILSKEGYVGYGVDLRARKSWALWESEARLVETSLTPAEMCLSETAPFPKGSFLIGNHADELTPWLPLLAAVTPNSAFLNIPCCLHTFTGRFTQAKRTFPSDLLALPFVKGDMTAFEDRASESGGRYNAYLKYLAEMTVRSGWRPEREALRIPSTKNWAFVGRRRIFPDDSEDARSVRQWIQSIAQDAQHTWTPRKPEGKDH